MKKPKLACADFTFPLLSHDEALDVIAMLGIKGVDIGIFAGRSHLQPKDIFPNVGAAARKLSKKLQDRGLKVADIFLIPSQDVFKQAPNSPSAGVRRGYRELFKRTLDFAVRCDAPHMTSLPGQHFEPESRSDSLKRSSETLAWCVEQANAAKVVFSVEAHMWSVAPTPKLAAQLVEMTPGLTLTLDYGHYTTQGMPDSKIEPLVKHAGHFHARAACNGLLQTTLKNNTIDYRRVVRAMKRSEYPGYIGLEYVRMDNEIVPDVDNLSETVMLRDLITKAWSARR
jgi:sugar phosphate isomerase/epimerase